MTYQPSDTELWQSVRQGQTAAFEKVVERYQGLVNAIAYSRLGSFEASQDVAQETFWVAWSSRDQLQSPDRLAAWLCGIARNLSHRQTRSLALAQDANSLANVADVSYSSDSAQVAAQREEAELVWNAVEQLPEMYRETMLLYYGQEQSVSEVASALEITPDAVKQRLSRARTMLRDDLATLVTETLSRSRPGKSFTSRVMSALAAMGAASAASTAQAAATSAAPLAAGAAKAMIGSLAPGMIGAAAGAASGLAGAYLGGYLSAEFAPTLQVRDYMRARARQLLLITLCFTIALTIAILTVVICRLGLAWNLGLVFGWQAIFLPICIWHSVITQRQVKRMQALQQPGDQPNPSVLRARVRAAASRFQGRSYTSRWKLASIPLLDIQISNPMSEYLESVKLEPLTARGWIAIGDRAYGILFGLGGLATGLVACGGVACGGLAIGGLAIGVLGMGGLALALIAGGGLAIGGMAFGGAAVGWHAAGGAAVGWQSAIGGCAIARHFASGGYALARDFAVGGNGGAAEFNTLAARQALEQFMHSRWLEVPRANLVLAITCAVTLIVIPNFIYGWLVIKKKSDR